MRLSDRKEHAQFAEQSMIPAGVRESQLGKGNS